MELNPIINAVIALLSVLITAFVIPWLRRKIAQEDRQVVAAVVDSAVKAAEKIYQGTERGEEKLDFVEKYLAARGYKMDANDVMDELRVMIEAAVLELGRA